MDSSLIYLTWMIQASGIDYTGDVGSGGENI